MKTKKSVDVITLFSRGDDMTPLQFKISLDDDFCDPAIEKKLLTVTRERSSKNEGILYNCHYEHGNTISFCNLRFDQSSHEWKLFRM